MTDLRLVNNAEDGDADHIGGNTWDALATSVNLGEGYMYLVKKSGSTYYVKNSAGAIAHSGATPATEIQWALDNCTVGRTHKEIVAIRGNITLTNVTIPSYTILDLTGAKLTQANATNLNMFINNDTSGGNTQIEIFGGTIDGNKAGQTKDAVPYNTRNTINLTKCTYSKVYGCTIVNSNSSGIYVEEGSNIVIDKNTITDSNKIGVRLYSTVAEVGHHAWITDNYLYNQRENQIAVSGFSDVYIRNNHTDICGTSSINCNGKRLHVLYNQVRTCPRSGISLCAEGTHVSDYSEIIGNSVFNAVTNDTTPSGYTDESGAGISVNVSEIGDQIIVKDNRVEGGTNQSINAFGIRFTHTHYSICENNRVSNWNRSGITVEGLNSNGGVSGRLMSNDRCIVARNIVWNNGNINDASAKNRCGVSIYGSGSETDYITNLKVIGNILYDNLDYGLRYANCNGVQVLDNDFQTNTVGAVSNGGNALNVVFRNNLGYVPEDAVIINTDSPYTILSANSVIRADATSGAITITLPTAVGITNKTYTIKRVDLLTNSNLVTIATTSSQTIGGATNAYLWSGESIVVESDNANWVILARNEPTSPLYYMIRGSRRYYAGNQGLYGTLLTSSTSPAANTLWALGFIVPKTTKFSIIGFNVTTGAAINARCGIYRDNNACYPGALIFDTGAIDCTATGSKDTTITAGLQVLPAGLYWLAWECASNTIQINSLGTTGTHLSFLGYAGGSINAGYGYSVAHTFGALPDPYTAGASILTAAPAVGAPVPAINLMPI